MTKYIKKCIIKLLAVAFLISCAGNKINDSGIDEKDKIKNVTDGINMLINKGKVGITLQNMAIARASGIMMSNRPYIGNGVQDCYGYVRQIWNAILSDGSNHSEDFYAGSGYTSEEKRHWVQDISNGLPSGDYPSSNWAAISSIGMDNLKPGDVVGTVQGHKWGMDVHYGIYAGKKNGVHYGYDCHGSVGAEYRIFYSGFRYYYKPIHNILNMNSVNYKEFKPGLLAREKSTGNLWFYPGDGKGAFLSRDQVGWGWNGMDTIIGVGDFDKDGHNDIISRVAASQDLYLYAGNGNGGFDSYVQAGSNWSAFDIIIGPGDWNGDGKTDVIARNSSNKNLYLYPGNGSGGFGNPSQIGNGWGGFDIIIGAGDFNGDGKPDIIARNSSTGNLILYPGNGSGGFLSSKTVGYGWNGMDIIFAVSVK